MANLLENLLYTKPGDNWLTNFLDSHSFLRNAWNLFIAELWASVVGFLWSLGKWTNSSHSRALLRRLYVFLFVSLFVVPVFNISSILQMVLEYIREENEGLQMNCVFSPLNGAYYVNSIFLLALFGNELTILRWRSLLVQGLIALSSSSWSAISVRCTLAACLEFAFDWNMADFLVNFTITTCLAAISPLLLPVGLFYSVVKHAVDSYCIIEGVYKVSLRLDFKPFYLTVVNIMMFSTLLCQIVTSGCLHFVVRRYEGDEDASYAVIVKYNIVLLLANLILFQQQLQSGQTWPLRVFDLQDHESPPAEDDFSYVPPELNWRFK
jgi:hypothetical protein